MTELKDLRLNSSQIKEENLASLFVESDMESFTTALRMLADEGRLTMVEHDIDGLYHEINFSFKGWNDYVHNYTAVWRVAAYNEYLRRYETSTKLNKILYTEGTLGVRLVIFRATQEIFNWEEDTESDYYGKAGTQLSRELYLGI